MFRAMIRWVKAVGYLLTGQIDSARRTLDTNPHVVRAKYEEIVREKTNRIQQYKQAVSGLIAQKLNKTEKVKKLTEEVGKLENLKAGALAKAKLKIQELKAAGKSPEEMQQDEEYKRCQSAYTDFSSTLTEKQARIEELEADIGGYAKRIGDHKVQLMSLLREIEDLKAEKADAVADMITAKEEKDIADTLAGIAQDGTAEELQRMRQLRQEVKAEAHISKEMAGTNTGAQEAEFLAYARTSQGSSEFDALIGLAGEAEGAEPAVPEKETEAPSGLPE